MAETHDFFLYLLIILLTAQLFGTMAVASLLLVQAFGKPVWCKYSNEPYHIDIKDITDDLFGKSTTSYNLSISWRSTWSLA